MTTPAHDKDGSDEQSPILATAQELLSSRLSVITPLAAAIAERKRLQGLLDDIEKRYGATYADAQAAGWTPEELRQMGAEEPTRRPQGRPKGARSRKARSAAPTPPAPRTPDTTESAASASGLPGS